MSESQRIAASVAAKRAARCRHFNGVQNNRCEAGKCYEELGEKGHRLPCLPLLVREGDKVAKCELYATFTAEEISEQMSQINEIRGVEIARAAVMDHLKLRGLNKDPEVHAADRDNLHRWYTPQPHYWYGAGRMPCPVCKNGVLSYSRAGVNGHIRAACSTDKCVRWVE